MTACTFKVAASEVSAGRARPDEQRTPYYTVALNPKTPCTLGLTGRSLLSVMQVQTVMSWPYDLKPKIPSIIAIAWGLADRT